MCRRMVWWTTARPTRSPGPYRDDARRVSTRSATPNKPGVYAFASADVIVTSTREIAEALSPAFHVPAVPEVIELRDEEDGSRRQVSQTAR
jgi:hypothetical protein